MTLRRFLSIVVLGLLFTLPAQADKVHGVMRVVKGEVQIKSADGKMAKARVGQKVYPQDTIITGKDARVKVVMVDNNEINVSPDSQVTIANYTVETPDTKKNVLIDVIYGKVRNKVNQKYDGQTSQFKVKTPSAVAGVRGTDFITSFNSASNSTQVITFHGAVAVGVPGAGGAIVNPVMVAAGQMTTAVNGQAPAPPSQVSASDLQAADKGSDAEKSHESKNDPRQPANEPGRGEDGDKADGNKEGARQEGQGPGGPNAGGPGEGDSASGAGSASSGDGPGKGPGGDLAGGGGGNRGPASLGPAPGPGGPNGPMAGGMPPGPGGMMDMIMPGDIPVGAPPPPMIIGSGPIFLPPPVLPFLPGNFDPCATSNTCQGFVTSGPASVKIIINNQ